MINWGTHTISTIQNIQHTFDVECVGSPVNSIVWKKVNKPVHKKLGIFNRVGMI